MPFNPDGTFRLLKDFVSRLSVRRDIGPIDSFGEVKRFASTRSAFIAQKTLYGYLKTRMGMQYPKVFEDDIYVESINIAKMQVFAACLSDLSIYAIARGFRDTDLKEAQLQGLAADCFGKGLSDNADQGDTSFSAKEAEETFRLRTIETDWFGRAQGRDNFVVSPKALIRWAPIAPELKKFDTEVVENSIKYAWNDVRMQYEKRIVADALAADVRRHLAGEN